ncbi:XRE family transcriptional regulator [Streptomonospora algeriensis]
MTTPPNWARRMRRERDLRGWTQRECVRRLRYETTRQLPDEDMLINSWKRWESGRVKPDHEYQRMIASLFGTVSGAMFADPRSPADVLTAAVGGGETPDLLARIRASSVDEATLQGLRMTADRLCADYPSVPAEQLLVESRGWLTRIGELLEHRMTLPQHREVLSIAGFLALLVGCLEQDIGAHNRAESTRRSALTLGTEADDRDVLGWAHEMRAWFSLTSGDYQGVLAASEAGVAAAGHRGVSVQLHAQEAKAWARIGDRSRVEVALDRGRRLLEDLPHPTDPAHHFVVDPSKFDYYAMDIYRRVGDDARADGLAEEVLSKVVDWRGRILAPMRAAEAHVTKGVVAARVGDLDAAVHHGHQALDGDRKSLPSLVMVGQELAEVLTDRYGGESDTQEYVDELRTLASST